jgi:hypothetical protein
MTSLNHVKYYSKLNTDKLNFEVCTSTKLLGFAGNQHIWQKKKNRLICVLLSLFTPPVLSFQKGEVTKEVINEVEIILYKASF